MCVCVCVCVCVSVSVCVCVCVLFWTVRFRAISALACLVSGSEGESKGENRETNEIESQGGSPEWSHRESHRENRGENEIESQGESQELFSSADIQTLLEILGKALDDNNHQSDGCSAVAIELGKC